eukprot:jgi/Tetstr1/427654/TSEL_017779.t1
MGPEDSPLVVTSRRPWCADTSSAQAGPPVRVIRETPRYAPSADSAARSPCTDEHRVLAARNMNRAAMTPEATANKLGALALGSPAAPAAPRELSRRSCGAGVALKSAGRRGGVDSGADAGGASVGARRPSTAASSSAPPGRSQQHSSAGAPLLPPPRRGMPSARLRQSASDPFARLPADATPFSAAYAAGAIPCRIYHGSVKHSLTWTTPPELLPTFDPLLVQCAGGLRETQYPHHFVACQAFSEMLQSPGAREKVLPLLPRVVPAIRLALLAGGKDAAVMGGALGAVRELAAVARRALVPHMKPILIQVAKKMFDRRARADVVATLQELERHGGEGMLALIKAKVPSYTPLAG